MSKSQTSFSAGQRITRRRTSAGPVPPTRPVRLRESHPNGMRGGLRPTFLTLRDHGKVYVADLPRLSDGQLAHIGKEAAEVMESLQRRLAELETRVGLTQAEQDTRIRASTKRDVTERFLRAIDEEQELRRNNPALRAAAGESLARAFMELARHRLPGATFDSLLQEALQACGPEASGTDGQPPQRESQDPAHGGPEDSLKEATASGEAVWPLGRPQAMPVVLTPAPAAS